MKGKERRSIPGDEREKPSGGDQIYLEQIESGSRFRY